MYENLEEALEHADPNALAMDGFDDCIIGIGSRCGQPDLLIYDSDKVIEKLMNEHGMSFEDASEHYQFNMAGAWCGEMTPIHMTRIGDTK